nr:DUF6125 family protein [Candidatus Njordarchaeum guaymaensis]
MLEHSEKDLEALLDLVRYAFLRLDGAWFIAAAEKCGVETATDLDIKAWETFSERLARKIVSKMNLQGNFCQVLPRLLGIQNFLMNMNGEITCYDENRAVLIVRDCEVWKMVSKVWTRETAPCHKVTQASIRGMLKGAFPETEFVIRQNKRIPLGDPCCEVEIIRKTPI